MSMMKVRETTEVYRDFKDKVLLIERVGRSLQLCYCKRGREWESKRNFGL